MNLFRITGIVALLTLVGGTAKAQSAATTRAQSLKMFNAYKPTIEAKNNAVVDEPKVLTGDVNRDGRTDAVVFFVMTPKGGGNAIVGREAAVYLGTPKGLKVAGDFPDVEECWAPDAIRGGVVYGTSYECAPPYMAAVGKVSFKWDGKRMVKM